MHKFIFTLAISFLIPVLPALAHDSESDSAIGQCVKEAKQVKNDAIKEIMSTFKLKKAACKGKDAACVEDCAATHAKTLEAIHAPLEQCKADCRDGLPDLRSTCKEEIGCHGKKNSCSHNAEFFKCMKGPQLEAFSCSRDCRSEFKTDSVVIEALKKEKTEFSACLKSCSL